MEKENKICQSCGMPLHKDPKKGGTEADGSLSDKYWSFCYGNGQFHDEGITLQEKIDKNVRIAVAQLGISETAARQNAEAIIPSLERWR